MVIVFAIDKYMVYIESKKILEESIIIIKKVEKFKNEKGFYPNSLEDIGYKISEGDFFFYQKEINHYIIYYNNGVGESNIYDSSAKKWKYTLVPTVLQIIDCSGCKYMKHV